MMLLRRVRMAMMPMPSSTKNSGQTQTGVPCQMPEERSVMEAHFAP